MQICFISRKACFVNFFYLFFFPHILFLIIKETGEIKKFKKRKYFIKIKFKPLKGYFAMAY